MAPFKLDFRRAAFYSKISLQLLCAAHLVSTHIIWSSPASGPSMLPTFELSGEHILTNGYYRRGRGVVVGDLVTYKIPIFVNEMGVKRVIGMPGDYVVAGMPGKTDMMIQVPEGHCWLAGDNLPASRDSKQFGPVPLALIRGKAIARSLPWHKRGWIENGVQPVTGEGSPEKEK